MVRGVLAELKRQGCDTQAWLHEAGVDQGMLTDLRAKVDVDTWDRMLRRAMHRLNDPSLGLTIGFGDSEGMLQLLGYMLMSSRTLQEAFELCQRYSPLVVDDLRVELVHVGPLTHFRFGFHSVLGPESLRFAEEVTAALAFRLGKHHTPDGSSSLSLHFRQAEPANRARFEELFQCPIRFGCAQSEIVFDRNLLLKTQPHGDGMMVESLTVTADKLLRELNTQPAFSERVRLVLSHEPELTAVDAARIASKLGMNTRVLRRRLRDEGANLRALIDESRMRAACVSLQNPNTTIKDTAERLGYSEPSAFHRAFKRWTGKTPADFMRKDDVIDLRSFAAREEPQASSSL